MCVIEFISLNVNCAMSMPHRANREKWRVDLRNISPIPRTVVKARKLVGSQWFNACHIPLTVAGGAKPFSNPKNPADWHTFSFNNHVGKFPFLPTFLISRNDNNDDRHHQYQHQQYRHHHHRIIAIIVIMAQTCLVRLLPTAGYRWPDEPPLLGRRRNDQKVS